MRYCSPYGFAWSGLWSTVGTDDPTAADALSGVADRVCALGRMQRPPLLRAHDGEDWLRATLRSVSIEMSC